MRGGIIYTGDGEARSKTGVYQRRSKRGGVTGKGPGARVIWK